MNVSASSRSAIRAIALGIAIVAIAGPVRAQQGAGTYAAPSLKIPVGARLMSSPDAVAGMRPDASLMYSNASFLAGMTHDQLFVSTAQWLDNMTFSAAGVAVPVGRGGTVLSFGTTFLYSGTLQGYNDALAVVTQESFYSAGFDASVAHAFRGTGISVAFGATYIREHVYPQDGSGVVYNAGASYWLGPNLFHIAARDLGGSVRFDSGTWDIAPEIVGGGGHIFNSPVGQFFAGAQVANSDAYGTRFQFGLDYEINPMITLRSAVTNTINEVDGVPFNAGFGFHYGPVTMDYAYTPQQYFSSTHTFSLSYSFGAQSGGRASTPVTVPAGDFAPPVPSADPVPPPMPMNRAAPAAPKGAHATVYVLVAGSHAWLESARAEARALELLKVPAKVESEGTHFRVVVARYDSRDAAEKALASYRSQGHVFRIVAE